MTVQGGFTSAAEQPCPDSQHQIQPALDSSSFRGPSATTTTTTTTEQSDASKSSTTAIAHADLHRQSHNPSKLPAFRFSDRSKSLGSVPLVNKGEPLSFSSNRYKRNKNQNLDSGIKNKDAQTIDYINYKPTASTIPTTSPTSAPTISSDSASAALPVQSSIEDSTFSPNPDPVSPAPGSLASETADPGSVLAPQNDAVSGPATTSNPDLVQAPVPVPAPAPAPTAPPLPATTDSDTSPPTTHLCDEKHAVAALTSAPTDTSTNTTSPALISRKSSTQPTELNAPVEATAPPPSQIHSRSTSLQPSSSSSVVHLSAGIKRPASFSDAHTPDAISPHHVPSTSRTRNRRSLVSRRSTAGASSTGPPLSLNSERLQAIEAIEAAKEGQFTFRSTVESSPIESPSGQRELILPKTLSRTNSDERRASASQRPPVSYRPPLSTNSSTDSSPSTAVRVPPIRSFRSSGSRKSINLDMNSRPRFLDSGDEDEDTNHDRTLRALEGRSDDEALRSAPVSSRRGAFDNEDTGDVFLKIAREETSQRQADEQPSDDNRSIVSRATRFTHRRPLSSVVPIHSPNSPPRVRRRLSDQRETSRSRSRGYEDDRATEVSRMSTYRTTPRDKAASAHPGEDLGRSRASTSTMRPSPVTPRSIVFQEPSSENSNYSRRRPSITDNNATGQSRSSAYKSIHHGHNKTYNSSPLVRSFDFQVPSNIDTGNGAEGTESTLSNTAPSTVWDELDDLKSRIHRLELTGKLPSTSGAAVSRLSDDRPPTATTTATTMSASPKRVENGHRQTADAVSTTSSHHQRESHNILQSALAKSKVLLDTDIYQALESAANDAISLASMMGTPGQPGPISSSASTIGSNVTVTDRQLRRKAESVCRSLTELCLALGEEATQTRMPRQSIEVPTPTQNEAPITPTINKTFSGFSQRRQSIGRPDKNVPKEAVTSPRTMSKFEERRLSILNGSSLPTSRASTSIPSTPIEPISSRRSSLLVSRARRAGTEEPDDGRTSSLLLRTRRAGTEEPDEGRRTSLFVRNRRNTVGEDSEDESRFRGPSRIRTDLNTIRVVPQEQTPQPAETSSAIPRRRYVSSTIGSSRLATPSANTATPPRRYVERSTQQDHGTSAADRFTEERAQRYTSLGQTTMVNRTGSMIRRPNRESIASGNPSTAAGSYR
ncbi:hypothetical protein FGSG_06975 [Fusarium graminearum PH-1]|uniref:Chromosome 4, complete genome n=1 Tax=Gibberella zeae (strain ATCC MYA-4620 / CBS 123657 / FGSC 9075 / NRRL 31084 / PH-1) TaxID=229533 RepID=I1RS62_GIBZE|nr:hypothetical protein FGSG_06975 [Fusarium graminearum PH-1]ESU13147.1 hypothetical protein FGSG_06975 [Fusarium graminearum PH-1]CAF3464804.1 unnamed protein product [Fusarium graminearum]CEF83552.1 unnamed protein product [Fusarium graminearum]|eukprot:XP_011326654.1 hypothetical protein FGSG_06975 [Fusarium graminearum PH-1]